VSEEVNRKFPARNRTVQLLTLYANPERHNAHLCRRTDRLMDRRTDRRQYDANSRMLSKTTYRRL